MRERFEEEIRFKAIQFYEETNRLGHAVQSSQRARDRRQGRLVKDVVHAFDRASAGVRIPDIAFDEFDSPGKVREVLALAGKEVVQDADLMVAFQQLFNNMRADESRPSRY
jgi:hypothetical protein